MMPRTLLSASDASEEVRALIATLHATGQRLEELTAGEVDTVADSSGRTFVLRHAQEQLRHIDDARQAAILNALPAHIALLDARGVIVSVNDPWQRFSCRVAHGPGQAMGLNYLDLCDAVLAEGASDAHLIAKGVRAVLAGEAKTFSTEYTCHSATEQYWFLLRVTPLADDRASGAVVMHLDITERVQAKRDSTTARTRLRHVVFESPAVLYALRVEGDTLVLAWISENVERLLGYTVEDVLAPDWWMDRLHPDDRERVLAEMAGIFVSNRLIQEYRFRDKQGGYVWFRDEKRVLRDAQGQPTEIVGSWSDVTVRKSTERRLLESEEEYRFLFDSNPHPMWVYDAETLAFLAVNDAAIALYGFSRDEFLGMTIREIRPPDQVPALLEGLTTGADPSDPEPAMKHRKKDGSLLDVTGRSNAIEFHGKRAALVLATDVTDNKRLESQLLQSQKMEAVGRLAGGVAHDFNNSLGVILGYTELLMRQASEPQRAKLEQILKAAKRATGLTRQLLAFSRKQVVDPKVLNLNALLSDLQQMLGRLLGEDVDLAIVPGAALGEVKIDPGQLEQVVINLCVNARDAMPDGGSLRIETGNVELDAGHLAQHETMTPGRYVMLAVSDAGCGIEKTILSTIFEPFFTTKAEGKGTGLGLAMVYGTVKQAGGYVWVDSQVGRGTTFKVYLPRIDEAVAAEAAEAPMPTSGWETILLVEDEASLREIAREILEAHGYRVIEASGGQEALDVAARETKPIHLLVTDVVMPGMNGRALAESLVDTHPQLGVLYMSGYTDDVIAHRGVLEAGTRLLEKPFTAVALLRGVRDVLEAKAAPKAA